MSDLQQIQNVRSRLEAKISELIEMLDLLDGDCDSEANGDDEPSIGNIGYYGPNGLEYDLEQDLSDDEPSLGWTADGRLIGDDDREFDPSEMGEPEDGQ